MQNKKLVIVIVATKKYQYALIAQSRAIRQNLSLLNWNSSVDIILVTCKNPIDKLLNNYSQILGDKCKIHHIILDVNDNYPNYKENAQLLITQLYTKAFDLAKTLSPDYLWTLESDVIPDINNLRCMIDMLNFDGGYYDVAFCPYVSSGKGGIMGGRGNDYQHILPNVYEDEREITQELKDKIEENNKKFKEYQDKKEKPPKELYEKMEYFKGEVEKSPPKGNVFTLNGIKWRQRGWLEWAFPGVGKGCVVNSDWMPTGNNLFSKNAIQYLDFAGYEGKGTQDLFLAFKKLKQHGIKICVIPHSVSHHVVRDKMEDGTIKYKIMMLRHESEGECVGHLRQSEHEFFNHEPGEEFPIAKEPPKKEEDFSI